ncbi:MAG: type VI secretion system tube protein Hcp [Acidobacteria bacterium]|nr:type VI secretion system tube protein Hcp [Acidobacteriota bacterium]
MATNMYLEFEPALETGMEVVGHEKQIEVLSWTHGFSQPTSPVRASSGGGTVEQADHKNLTFTKYLDGSSTAMLKKCWAGEHFTKATLHCYRASKETEPLKYLEIVMEHVIVCNWDVVGGPGEIPIENVALDYGILTYNYISQKRADGTGGGNKPAKHNLETREISDG